MSYSTTYVFAKPSILCKLIGHFHKQVRAEVIGSAFEKDTRVVYHECRFCRTRRAEMSGEFNPDRIDFTWLREYFDGH